MRSSMEFDGFDWRRGATYIVINKNLTSSLVESPPIQEESRRYAARDDQ